MPPRHWSRAWKTASWLRRLSGLTSSRSMGDVGVDMWMLSLPVSRVSPGAPLAKATGPQTNGGSGPTSEIAFAKWNPDSSSWRMSLPLFLEADWPSFSGIWPTSGSMRSGVCSPQPEWVPPIDASACSSWPTAAESDSRSSGRHTTSTGVMHPGTSLTDSIRAWPTPRAEDGESCGNYPKGQDSLTGVTRYWRTPNAGGPRNRQGSRGNGHQVTIAEQAEHWPTPNVPNGGRVMNAEDVAAKGATDRGKRQVGLESVASLWPTPQAQDGDERNSLASQMRHADQGHQPSLHSATGRWLWPTPAATPYGSSQNGINGIGGEHERPSANTPSLERMSRSFLPDLLTSSPGDASSPSDPTSRQPSLWKTPHGFANTDVNGRTGGGGGEFHKQAMQWPTPQCYDAENPHAPRLKADRQTRDPNTPGSYRGDLKDIATGGGKAKLNPQFVEWLMGLPIGWTGSGPAATAFCRWQQQSRSACWRLVQA